MTEPLLILITNAPQQPLAKLAVRYACSALAETNNNNKKIEIFFYGNGASTANGLTWQSAEQTNICHEWQKLAEQYQLNLSVCVSTALARGVTDKENSQRHQLSGDNIAEGFRLVGLSELVMKMANAKVVQF
ncbi:MAG: sulfurtransferase complex subunit TusD [Moraxellaceae bacterium]|nr:sulfurtransferase complex subunit TusD [Moraxellaceae bacterium]